jgi:hypothetical protein
MAECFLQQIVSFQGTGTGEIAGSLVQPVPADFRQASDRACDLG